MYPLLDHDDFAKSRKALLATSAFLLLLNHLQIVGDNITILGLNLKIDRNVILGFGSLFLIYFSYAFIIRGVEQYFASRLSGVTESLTGVIEEIKRFSENQVWSETLVELENRVSEDLKLIKQVSGEVNKFVTISLEVVPPLLLAGYTAYSVNAISAIFALVKA